MTRRFAVLAALGLVACRHGAAPPPPQVVGRPPAPAIAAGGLDATVILGDLPSRAARLGAGPPAIVAAGEAVEGERLGAFVDLPPDACLLAYARSSSSIEDLDLAAFDDDGSPIAVDEAPDAKPTLLLCPPHPPRVYVAAHVAIGEGLVGVAAQLVPLDRAPEVGRGLSVHGALGEGPRPPDGFGGLDDHVRAHRDALGGTWEEIRKVAVVLDSRVPTAVTFPVEADQCVDAVIVPSDEVLLLEVEALDESGRVVARAHEGGSDRSVTLCSPITMAGSLSIRPHVGRGLAAVVLARTRASGARDLTSRPEVAWAPGSVSLDEARADRAEALARAGYGGPTFATKGALALGRRTSTTLDLAPAAGACARIDVVAGAPLALIEARVWGERGELVTAEEGAWGATLFACARGKGRLDLETQGRAGPFAVESRAERWRDPAFAAHPLAAARMLARASEGPASILEGTAAGARSATLEPDRLTVWTRSVAAGQCARTSVGAEGEGTGLELRAFDAASGEEVDRSHAERAVSTRVCAPAAAARSARWELRTTSGKLDVVIGERSR